MNQAVLPSLLAVQIWQALAWGVVAAAVSCWLLGTFVQHKRARAALAVSVFAFVAWPGPWGGAYWLSLAFQAPSVLTVLLSSVALAQDLRNDPLANTVRAFTGAPHPLGMCALILGWVLLLDTVGVLPVTIYDWGFSAVAPAIALALVACPWLFSQRIRPDAPVAIASATIFIFVLWHLPSGNVFDALIDPLAWLVLHGVAWRQWKYRPQPHKTVP